MATITLKQTTFGCTIGMGAFEGIGVAFSSLKQSANNLTEALGSLKAKIGLASIGVNVSESQEQTKAAHEREKNKKSSLSLAYDKLSALISDVGSVDIKASSKIRERKETFYDRYYYLKPECEKTKKEKRKDKRAERWQNVKDFWGGVGEAIKNFVVSVGEWCKENWELLAAAFVAIAVVVFAVCTFGAGAVLIAAMVGAAVGFLSQALGDVIATGMHFFKTGKLEWQGSSWQEYLGSTLGGALGGILMLTGHPMAANMFASGFSTFFSGHLSNATGGEKRSSLEILGNTAFSVGMSALFTKVGDKVGKSLSRSFPQITFFRRLAGRNSYEASFKGKLTAICNGNQKISGLTYKTFRNGIVSGMFGNSFETVFNSVTDFDFSNFVKNVFTMPKLQVSY